MATIEQIAIRQHNAAARIAAAIGLQLPHVKGPSPFKHAVHLEMIADHLQGAAGRATKPPDGDSTPNNEGSIDHERQSEQAGGSAAERPAEPGRGGEGDSRVQRQHGGRRR